MSKSKTSSKPKPKSDVIINQSSKSKDLSSEEDNFEEFLKKYRNTVSNTNQKTSKTIDSKEFEHSRQDKLVRAFSSNELNSKLSAFSLKSSKKSSESSIVILSSDDDDENVNEEELLIENTKDTDKSENPIKSTNSLTKLNNLTKESNGSNTANKLSFIESLNQKLDDETLRDSDALRYLTNFRDKNIKIDLLNKLYNLFNETIFENKLPKDTMLIWNPKLTSSGGYCKKVIQNKISSIQIHISVKICDTPEIRDTLLHEMCHGAAFIVDGLLKDNHGAEWQKWAKLSNSIYKTIPMITKCHSYASEKKFIYRCQNCQYEFHRNRRSVDIKKYACGNCNKGKFEIIENEKLAKRPTTRRVKSSKDTEKKPNINN